MRVIAVDMGLLGDKYGTELCSHLEAGNILMLEHAPFAPAEADRQFLRDQKQSESSAFKNVAYKPHLNKTTGLSANSGMDCEAVHRILSQYSKGAVEFVGRLLPRYGKLWKLDFATYRPIEEQGRDLPLKRRNDLMHVDAFPTRPTNGGRILRIFTNIHPTKPRVWVTSDPFDELCRDYAIAAGLGNATSASAAVKRALGRTAKLVGMKAQRRTAYDDFMQGFHHYLKGNEKFQTERMRDTTSFPAGTTWMAFTDQIAHSVKSGQYAIEQTCIVPVAALVKPECAPLAVLERMTGRKLV
jgi:hypothetical protein